MKKLFFVLTLLTLSSPAFGQTDNVAHKCAQIKINPKINLYTSYGKLNYDFTKSTKEINILGNKYGHIETGLFAQGLSLLSISNQVTLSTESEFLSLNEICVVPSSIDIFIGYSNPTIYVAEELNKGSCEFNLILRHEKAHQQINKTALDYFMPQIYQAVVRFSKDIKPILIDNTSKIDSATKYMNMQYLAKIKDISKRLQEEIIKEQKKLDNREHYKLEGELCKNFNKNH